MNKLFSCCFPNKKEEDGDFKTYFQSFEKKEEINPVKEFKGVIFYDNQEVKEPELVDQHFTIQNNTILDNIENLKENKPKEVIAKFSSNKFKLGVSPVYGMQNSRMTFGGLSQPIPEGTQNTEPNNENIEQNLNVYSMLNNDQPTNDTLLNGEKVTDIEVQSNKILELIELDGSSIPEKKILINAGGLVKGGFRNAKDGYSYFGLSKKNRLGQIVNDYLLNIQSKYNISTIFKIFFNRLDKKYYLSCDSIEDDTIVLFIKLDKPFKLFKKHILSLGEVHLSAEVDSSQNLKIEIVYGNEEIKYKIFKKEHGKMIKLGRNKDNDIVLESFVFSRVHTSFFFSQVDNSWHVQDCIDDKKSTNGTWLYLDWSYCIERKTIFRIGKNTMSVNYI